MNNDQGPGFQVLGGKVVDKRTLTMIASTMVSFFATAIPLMISMQADPLGKEEAVGNGCGLTADQQRALDGMLVAFNVSCSFTDVLNATCNAGSTI